MKLSDEHLRSVLKMYGREFARLDFVASGYRNTSHIVETTNNLLCNLIVYKREPGIAERIERINQLSVHVRSAGLPVRVPLDTRLLQIRTTKTVRYACLYSFEYGTTIPWEAYTKKHIKLLGMALGRFHEAGKGLRDVLLPSVASECMAQCDSMENYFAKNTINKAILQKLRVKVNVSFRALRLFLQFCDDLPDQQPLHMDFVRGNVLFRTAEVGDRLAVGGLALSGILDLEKASQGHPLFDVARSLAFLLVDCNKPSVKIYSYFLNSGYLKRGGRELKPVRLNGCDVLEQMITFFLVYDFYKFLRQNPYESLQDNHHFVRTRDILVERKVLQLT